MPSLYVIGTPTLYFDSFLNIDKRLISFIADLNNLLHGQACNKELSTKTFKKNNLRKDFKTCLRI